MQFSGDLAKMLHPGGTPPLLEVAGTDATETFFGLHRAEILQDPRFAKLKIGELTGGEGTAAASGEAVPYAESLGFWRKSSPYYRQSHDDFRAAIRDFYEEAVAPFAEGWDEDGEPASPELFKQLGEAGIVASLVAGEERGAQFLERWGIALPGGVNPREFDYCKRSSSPASLSSRLSAAALRSPRVGWRRGGHSRLPRRLRPEGRPDRRRLHRRGPHHQVRQRGARGEVRQAVHPRRQAVRPLHLRTLCGLGRQRDPHDGEVGR